MMRGNQHGFTLVEVLLATAILAIIMVLVYTSFDQTANLSRYVESVSGRYRVARIVLSKFSDELISTFQTPDGSPPFKGMDGVGTDGHDMDRLTYTSMSRSRTEGQVGSYLHGLEYHMDGSQLIYTETPNVLAQGAAQSFLLIDGLAGFKLRYQNRTSGEWRDGWDSNGLPAAVEVTLQFPDVQGSSDEFSQDRTQVKELSTVIRIPMEGGA